MLQHGPCPVSRVLPGYVPKPLNFVRADSQFKLSKQWESYPSPVLAGELDSTSRIGGSDLVYFTVVAGRPLTPQRPRGTPIRGERSLVTVARDGVVTKGKDPQPLRAHYVSHRTLLIVTTGFRRRHSNNRARQRAWECTKFHTPLL